VTKATKCRWFAYLVLIPASTLVVGVAATPVSGQGFNFQNFSSVANLQLNGNAARAGNVLRLTPTSAHNVGSAWFTTQQQVQKGFTTVFQFRITDSSPPSGLFHADGFAFVIQNSSVTALGGDGSGIGYGAGCGFNTFPCGETPVSGIPHSLAVEFDTFKNMDLGDPNDNHIAVQSCGTLANSSSHLAEACAKAITSPAVNLSDGAVHTVVINYDPCTGECSGTLKIYLDSNTPVLTASFNLPNIGLSEGGTAFVGFTGSTGALVENNDILSWSFSVHEGDTTNAILTFTPDHPSQVATFGCTGPNDCTNDGASSVKFSLKQVNTPFTIVVSATRVDGDGICESGMASNFPDFDCRFVTFFGTPIAGMPPQVRVPLCYPYLTGSPHCVYYRVENPPPSFAFQGPDLIYVAWNGIVDPGPNYFKDNPHLYRAPTEQQFSLDITEYYISSGGQVGKDPGVGGESDDFSDFVVAFPQKPAGTFTFILQPPLPPIRKTAGSTVNIFFQLKNGNMFVNNAHIAPNHLGFAVLDTSDIRQRVQPPGDSPAISFDSFTQTYQVHFKADLPAGNYQVCIDSNLFAQQCIALVLQ
jgi:Legume lectin domain